MVEGSYIIEDRKGVSGVLDNIKKFWYWIWNSDSILSWIVALVIIYVFIKYIFFPGLGFVMGTSLPLAGVESSSMDHQIASDDFRNYGLCGNSYSRDEKKYINFDEYWYNCGEWYEGRNISKEDFKNFYMHNGFRKGDIVVVWGRFEPKIGNIIIFKPNPESTAPHPIVHRVVSVEEVDGKKILQTKGDHNKDQLKAGNNPYDTNEIHIEEEQIIGKVVFKIPLLGWFKIWVMELWDLVF